MVRFNSSGWNSGSSAKFVCFGLGSASPHEVREHYTLLTLVAYLKPTNTHSLKAEILAAWKQFSRVNSTCKTNALMLHQQSVRLKQMHFDMKASARMQMALSILNFVFITKAATPSVYWINLKEGDQKKIPRSSRTNHPARSGANEWVYSGRTEKTLVPTHTL